MEFVNFVIFYFDLGAAESVRLLSWSFCCDLVVAMLLLRCCCCDVAESMSRDAHTPYTSGPGVKLMAVVTELSSFLMHFQNI